MLDIHRTYFPDDSPNRRNRQSRTTMMHRLFFLTLLWLLATPIAFGDDLLPIGEETPPDPPIKPMEIAPEATDEQIQIRIRDILEATGWYDEVDVRVREGVVFLDGITDSAKHQADASQLVANMEGTVFPINNIQVRERSAWDFSPALEEMTNITRSFLNGLPFLIAAILLLVLAWFVSVGAVKVSRRLLSTRIENFLLRRMLSQLVGILILIVAVYMVLRVSGLTNLAVTVLGGTGVAGIVLGFAFRDIAENFLASLLVSLQTPFQKGDLIEVAGEKGFVQRVTTRGTVLMTFEGTYVQIPNSTIYKSVIRNYTANDNVRQDFIVGIDYEDSIADAQNLAMEVLAAHPAVLNDPAPSVLVNDLGAATVNLAIFFWVNARDFSAIKVRSAIIRQVKQAFMKHGLVLPDESREVIFPRGVPVHMLDQKPAVEEPPSPAPNVDQKDSIDTAVGEGDLTSEADVIKKQANESREPTDGKDLLPE